MSQQEITAKAQYAVLLGGNAVITGAWVWVDFSGKPSDKTREALKAEGFKWAPKKGKWYFAGRPRVGRKPMGWDYITSKYGVEPVKACWDKR